MLSRLRPAALLLALLPIAVTAGAAPEDCTERNACLTRCWDLYHACAEQSCDEEPEPEPEPIDPGPMSVMPAIQLSTAACDDCYDRRLQCERACPACVPCTEPKNVYPGGEKRTTEDTWPEEVGCFAPLGLSPSEWVLYVSRVRVDQVQLVESCDGTITEQVVSTDYEYSGCWSPTNAPCFGTSPGSPSPQCP